MPDRTQREQQECNRNQKSAFDRLLETDESFYWRVSRRMARSVERMRLPPSEVDRVVADAWLKAVKHRDFFEGDAIERRLRCWLLRVVHSKAVDAVRRLVALPFDSLDRLEFEFIDHKATESAEAADLHECLSVLLEQISPTDEKNLDLLRAHYLQGISIRELARLHGRTIKSVDNRIRRLVDKLRALWHEAQKGTNILPRAHKGKKRNQRERNQLVGEWSGDSQLHTHAANHPGGPCGGGVTLRWDAC